MSETYAPSGTVSATVVSRFTAAEAATGTMGTMDRAVITELLDRTRYLDQTGQLQSALKAFIGDNANTFSTLGLTINQGAADDEAVSLKSSDVSHGMTTLTEDDTYATLGKAAATTGGVALIGYGESTGALSLVGRHTTDDTTKSTAGAGAVRVDGLLKSGTTTTTVGANANIFIVSNGSATRFIFDQEGDFHADSSSTTF